MGRKKSPEKQKAEREQFKWDQAVREVKFCPEPTYQFNVSDSIKIGFLENAVVIDKYFDGKLYKIEYDSKLKDSYGRDTDEVEREYQYFTWYKLRPIRVWDDGNSFIRNEDVRLYYMNTSIHNILGKKYYFGLDMDPDYQRGYVWTQEDKENLIDSIFNNIDIGKFVFIHKPISSEYLYEVLDGKQRITAICEFYENRFPYKGKYFNDLCVKDQNHFEDYHVSLAEIESADKETVLQYFLMLNTTGKAIDKDHLEKVRKLYEDEKVIQQYVKNIY